MQTFSTCVDIEILRQHAFQRQIDASIRKMVQNSDLQDTDKNIATQLFKYTDQLKSIMTGLANGSFTKDDGFNTLPEMARWAKINSYKTTSQQLKKSLRDLYYSVAGVLQHLEAKTEKLAKAGVAGKSGRKIGYDFNESEHVRDSGGKFSSKGGTAGSKHYTPTTGAGRKLPSYGTERGRRLGRGITYFPEERGDIATRVLGHMGGGIAESLVSEPVKAASKSARDIRSQQLHESAIKDALRNELRSGNLSNEDKTKVLTTLERMEVERIKRTGRTQQTVMGDLKDQLRAGAYSGIKQVPYSMAVGAAVGLSRALNEKLRTIPALAPLELRVRPDIMESGLRTGVSVLRHRGISRVIEIANKAKNERRPMSVEEYSTVADIVNLSPQAKSSVVRMAEALEESFRDAKKFKDMQQPIPESILNEMNLLEQNLDNIIGKDLAISSVPKLREVERSKSKANLPIFKPNKAALERAQTLLNQFKGK